MKRKLFTLLVSLLIVAGFAVNAKTVVIETGNWTNAPALNSSADERGGYGSSITTTPNKLTPAWMVAPGAVTALDRLEVVKADGDYVKFSSASGGDFKLKHATTNITYDKFVIFKSKNNGPLGAGGSADYTPGGTLTNAFVTTVQDIDVPGFDGYIAATLTTGYVTASNLVIVVHDKDGNLALMYYKEYYDTLVAATLVTTNNPATTKQWYPLYIKESELVGRWATPADFEGDCKFFSFKSGNTTVNIGGSTLFSARMVDWIDNSSYSFVGKEVKGVQDEFYGCYEKGGVPVIPLFAIQDPQNNCKVLSVSRLNDLKSQIQTEAGYANRLEFRGWGEYAEWQTTPAPAKYVMKNATSANFTEKTSLQKFAIWIDEEGDYTLYPLASYYWKYGFDKETQKDSIENNTVLLNNNLEADDENAISIGHWKGVYSDTPVPGGYLGTIPNKPQTYTQYEPRSFKKSCATDEGGIEGHWFFLQVAFPDTTDYWKLPATDPRAAAFKPGAYQFGREYVLSTRLHGANIKGLTMVPKEKIRSSAVQYWDFPYDSVNMAAHWKVQKVEGGYKLTNMLGDVLQYNPASTPDWLAGGYFTENWEIPGGYYVSFDYGAINMHRFGPGAGVPDDQAWFKPNTNTGGSDLWKIYKVPGTANKFFMELAVPNATGFDYYDLAFHNTVWTSTPTGGWFNDQPRFNFAAGKNIDGSVYNYWQKLLKIEQYVSVPNEAFGFGEPLPACAGLQLSLESIYYSPKDGPRYGESKVDVNNGIYNTQDPDFTKRDSLTAYTFLTGSYNIMEAKEVPNNLVIGVKPTYNNAGIAARTVAAASFVPAVPDPDEDAVLQFIPLASVSKERNAEIAKFSSMVSSGPTLKNLTDTLYGETYKWYLVKLGNKYLTVDTINMTAKNNREKIGLAFEAINLANATPVRLYQPLVGDKKNDNFLFQFYLPAYRYIYSTTNPTVASRAPACYWPEIEDPYLGTSWFNGGNEVCFATLMGQTDYIYVTKAYSGIVTPTRFTFAPAALQPPPVCDQCDTKFITPTWMANQRLLNLPLKNEIWNKGKPADAWIAGTSGQAWASNTASEATLLTHTLVDTIVNGILQMRFTYPSGSSTAVLNYQIGNAAKSFEKDFDVPLYHVQNAEGKYLTVVPKCDMWDPTASTYYDVNGVKLEWRDKYQFSITDYNKLGYYPGIFQLFAIAGCEVDPVNGKYGTFVYLPLASYVSDYKTGNIVETFDGSGIYLVEYNWKLGKLKLGCSATADLSECLRVSQYEQVGPSKKDLVVFRTSGHGLGGNLVPLQVKWMKLDYAKPSDCDYYLVKNVTTNKFYSFENTVDKANDFSLFAHWKINFADTKDTDLATFTPELTNIYGSPIVQTQLKGDYYFIQDLGDNKYKVMDVTGYGSLDFTAKFLTFELSCAGHDMPFYRIESDYSLLKKLAILEAPYTDRNMTDEYKGDVKEIILPNSLKARQTYIKQIGDDFDQAHYVNVYAVNEKALTDNHTIQYYAFSVEPVKGQEYFLNVNTNAAGQDSVYWSALSPANRKALLVDFNDNPAYLKQFKFCLPYKFILNSKTNEYVQELVKYGDKDDFPAVYMQTWEVDKNDSPFILSITVGTTWTVGARKLVDAMLNTSSLSSNIYTVDYRDVDQQKAAAWIFGGEMPKGNVWVPIADAIATGSAEGVLTDPFVGGGGVLFIDRHGSGTPDYGTVTGINDAKDLKLEYDGTATIGSYALSQIWYYRITLDGKYLTDATGDAAIAPYLGSPYGYFNSDKLPAAPAFAADNITSDAKFVQSFGFKYVTDSNDPKQLFYVVANANYSTKPTNENNFRYLREVNNRLVFTSNPDEALVFQWGKITDGKYVDLKVVGVGGIFGVEGGVKFLNTTGKVDLFTIDGRLIKSAVLTGGEQIIPAPRGIAVVKNGSNVVKVVVQ